MKIILLQDVDKIGKKYEVKNVADGYGRNFLLAKGLAKIADEESLKLIEKQKEELRVKAEEELGKIQQFASTLDGFELTIPFKLGDKDQLFESVTSQKVAEKLKEQGFDIKKTQIILPEPIKEMGEFPVKIQLGHNLEVEIKLIIIEEK
ncbi:MAG: 50S ribosomal protein L9 [Candidatus Nealsonbacteria bacterium]|nr:50S ribosomal protein L9 [Candidatus Nealsonbacteria bacterium]